MQENTPVATVCIPTYNGEEYLRDLLKSVFRQKFSLGKFEVLVIDSGSTDNTLSIVSEFPLVNLHHIPNSDFGHGKTRNLAARLAQGEYIIFLSQDAVPANSTWLEFMIEPFYLSDKVFCVFGKQIPHKHADATTKREVSSVFNSFGGDESILLHRKKSLVTDKVVKPYLTFFSDVNSAVKRIYLINVIPFRDVRYSEDQLLGKDALNKGYLKAYAPKGAVIHSNEYRLRDYFYRKYDENLGIYETLGITQPSRIRFHVKKTVFDILKDYKFIIKDSHYSVPYKVKNMCTALIRNPLKQYAAYLVANQKRRENIGLKHSLEAKKKS